MQKRLHKRRHRTWAPAAQTAHQDNCCQSRAVTAPKARRIMMNVVALVSGGKDSCYSILQCQKHGHKVVALGNLLPADSSVDELDSYMYQTVGHQLVSAYATCTGLPLYRRRIQGHSRSQGLSYSTTAGDEVEDLFLLLAYIKAAHPDITAVASGAIASDYQRLRVESVCSRLGLVSLGYLWHQPQDRLLEDMIASDIEAVLVKVAALGLDPHKHLGKSIRQLQPHLRRLRDRFGCNVCGEGGEYETLTLDCPAFTHGCIVLDSWEVVLHSPDSIAAVGVLHPTAFHIEPKEGGTAASPHSRQAVTEVPLDWQPQVAAAAMPAQPVSQPAGSSTQQWQTELKLSVSQQHVHIMCSAHAHPDAAHAASASGAGASICAEDTAAAVDAALSAVTSQLAALAGATSWQLSCFVHLYLADMSHFGAANSAYCRHLPQTNPPSRACVQMPLPAGCPVLLDVLFARQPVRSSSNSSTDTSSPDAADVLQPQHVGEALPLQQQPDRRVLHVQSISDWAPSCIGPYSQATSCLGITHMAGQIPLDPGSMNIVTAGHLSAAPDSSSSNDNTSSCKGSSDNLAWAVAAQVWRTLCSCQAVAVAVRSCFASSCLGLTVYLTPEAAAAGAQDIVQAGLRAVRQDRDLLSFPDRMPQALAAAAAAVAGADAVAAAAAADGRGCAAAGADEQGCGASSDGEEDEQQQESFVDDYLRPPKVQHVREPAVVYLTVPALPRGALLEVQPLLLDLSTAADVALASSSSSGDEDASPAPAQEPATPPAEGVDARLAGVAALQQHCVLASVTQSANGTWRRVLLQLQAGAGGGAGGQVQDTRQAQIAAVGSWLAACCPQCVASLRCWYGADSQEQPGCGAVWAQALLSALPPGLAGQLVPVLCADTPGAADSMVSSWCCVELLLLA